MVKPFWQRRIHADDQSTPLWYPFQTNSGAIRQDRLVFPIPPGVHWKEVRAVAVPTEHLPVVSGPSSVVQKPLKRKMKVAAVHPRSDPGKVAIFVGGKIRYIDKPGFVPQTQVETAVAKVKMEKPPAPKFDPRYLVAARELRDRWLEQVNGRGIALPAARHEVARGRVTADGSQDRACLLGASPALLPAA